MNSAGTAWFSLLLRAVAKIHMEHNGVKFIVKENKEPNQFTFHELRKLYTHKAFRKPGFLLTVLRSARERRKIAVAGNRYTAPY